MVRIIAIRTRSDNDATNLAMGIARTNSIRSILADDPWETNFGHTFRLLVASSLLAKDNKRRADRNFELDHAGIADAGA